MKRSLLAALVLVTAACASAAPEAEPFQGVWRSQGWGIVLDVHGAKADIYEISAAGCLLATSGTARNIDDVVTLDGDELVLDDGGRVIRFDALDAVPAECLEPADDSAAAVVAATVAAIEEHYHPGVDPGWAARVEDAGAADESGLEAAIAGLLAPLGDPQLALRTEGAVWSPPGSDVPAALATALEGLEGAAFTGEGGLVTADLGGGVRYLGLLRLGGFGADETASLRALASALDVGLFGAAGLVIDLRAATTGSDAEALFVATRFVAERTVVATFTARTPGGGSVAAGEAVVNPLATGPYSGPIVVLVGPGTSGPAELLALALAPLEKVTIVGEATAGSPRSPLVRRLPNGWVLGVPNTEVVDAAGVLRVGVPLPPDVAVVTTAEDLAAGRDPALDAAREVLMP